MKENFIQQKYVWMVAFFSAPLQEKEELEEHTFNSSWKNAVKVMENSTY